MLLCNNAARAHCAETAQSIGRMRRRRRGVSGVAPFRRSLGPL